MQTTAERMKRVLMGVAVLILIAGVAWAEVGQDDLKHGISDVWCEATPTITIKRGGFSMGPLTLKGGNVGAWVSVLWMPDKPKPGPAYINSEARKVFRIQLNKYRIPYVESSIKCDQDSSKVN